MKKEDFNKALPPMTCLRSLREKGSVSLLAAILSSAPAKFKSGINSVTSLNGASNEKHLDKNHKK